MLTILHEKIHAQSCSEPYVNLTIYIYIYIRYTVYIPYIKQKGGYFNWNVM
jgi:hypothetical protein